VCGSIAGPRYRKRWNAPKQRIKSLENRMSPPDSLILGAV
jgi:hypothetical protein